MGVESMDTAALDRLGERWGQDAAGAMSVGLVYLGDQLGLFAALRDAGPLNSQALADRTGLVERYVREWLAGMAAAEYLAYDPASSCFTLTPEQAAVFADPESLSFAAPTATFVVKNLAQADGITQAFRHGGGVPFSAYGEQFIADMDRAGGPGYRARLVSDWLPAMPGAVARLTAGGSFLDVGCGGGMACIEVARAFPQARVLGLDRHPPSIDRARAAARAAGVDDRARFDTIQIGELPSDTRFDVVTTFDVVHDLADPVGVLHAIREVLAPGGGYLMAEIKVSDRLEENIGASGQLLYGFSVFHCMTTSLADGGLGLGTCMGPAKARELADEAGFGTFTVLPIDDAFQSFYELRR